MNGRSFEQLIYTSAGVSIVNTMAPNARQGRANAFSTAGARPQGYMLMMDDEAIDNFFKRGMGTITGSSLGMEGMAEFQILTNTYGAQFGGMGAVMNAVSKSGTNDIHGSAYLFERNSAMDSRGFFDPSLNPFRRTQPGGSVGGPIKKDKAFFFFNYEGIWQLQSISHIAIVPDANHRIPTFAEATNPAAYNAVLGTLAIYPLPTFGFNSGAGTGEANVIGNNIAHENFILGRFDYTLTDKDSLFIRYFYDKQHVIDPYAGGNGSVSAGYLPFWPEKDEGMNHFATAEWRRIVSPTLVNTARISFSRPNTGDYDVNSYPALQVTSPGAGRPDPEITISGITPLGQSFFVPAVDIQNRFTVKLTTSCGPKARIPCMWAASTSKESTPTSFIRSVMAEFGLIQGEVAAALPPPPWPSSCVALRQPCLRELPSTPLNAPPLLGLHAMTTGTIAKSISLLTSRMTGK